MDHGQGIRNKTQIWKYQGIWRWGMGCGLLRGWHGTIWTRKWVVQLMKAIRCQCRRCYRHFDGD